MQPSEDLMYHAVAATGPFRATRLRRRTVGHYWSMADSLGWNSATTALSIGKVLGALLHPAIC